MTGTLREDQYTFFIYIADFLRMRNFRHRSCRENRNTHFGSSNFSFENRAVYGIMWKNIVERGRAQMAIWRMGISCCITRAAYTQSQCTIHIELMLIYITKCLYVKLYAN